ncbi:YbjQ family protein [Cuneatibacter sp. NSJ-177]|uniref:heavy metal-binding domain-containing protein n=1 Tax=Cuneatibacter sp. NSJ-177 TaxID=2931401 RepID=UPI001FD4314E|nr:YbjQ family protein [Cuneatibacter sp. NSJ-177]
MNKVMITMGYNFEGYRIVEYLGIVAVDMIIDPKDVRQFGEKHINEVYTRMREDAIKILKQKVIDLGGNGIIGFNNYIQSPNPAYPRGFSCMATAVRLE